MTEGGLDHGGQNQARQASLDELVAGIRGVGLEAGAVALVHSALSTFGPVAGGASTVVDALLQVLGPAGTLVAPTFTFAHEAEVQPIIDPGSDRSEMGAITEAIRQHPLALRSTAFRHSFAAIGPRAEVITKVDERLSPFDLRSSFGVMLALDAQIVLLGVTYASSTSHHFAEWVCDVPYRHTLVRHVRVRRPDGRLVRRRMVDYQPRPSSDGSYYGTRGADFNHLGRLLEERGRVGVAAIANAIVRRFSMRDLVDLARREAARDYNVFRTAEGEAGHVTVLADGQFAVSKDVLDGAGRPGRHL